MGRVRTASVVLCFLMLFVIDVSFSLIKCVSYHWYLQPNGFAAPILLLRAPLITRLRNGSFLSNALFRGGYFVFHLAFCLKFVLFFNYAARVIQQWQSLSCARIVIIRQRDQKESSGTMKDKANEPPNNNQRKPPVPDQSSKRRNKLRLSRQTKIPGSQQEIVRGQCRM